MAFTRSLFNSSFKTNPWLERAIMTGITRTSKESIFSDLNNLKVDTPLNEGSLNRPVGLHQPAEAPHDGIIRTAHHIAEHAVGRSVAPVDIGDTARIEVVQGAPGVVDVDVLRHHQRHRAT